MLIVIVRHGETPQNQRGVFQGQSDPGLHDVGIKQFQKIAALLKGEVWSAIGSSNYQRSQSSAGFLRSNDQTPLFVSEDFAERNLGVLDGRSKEFELAADPELSEKLMTLEYAPALGETGRSALDRFVRGVRKVSRIYSGQALVVSHGGVVALFAHFVLGVPRSEAFLKHGDALIIKVSGDGIHLVGMNVAPESIILNLRKGQ